MSAWLVLLVIDAFLAFELYVFLVVIRPRIESDRVTVAIGLAILSAVVFNVYIGMEYPSVAVGVVYALFVGAFGLINIFASEAKQK